MQNHDKSLAEYYREYCQREYNSLNQNSDANETQEQSKPPNSNQGRWSKEEHLKFVESLLKFGKNWRRVEEHIKTRSGAQIRSHAQKFFNKLEKEYRKQQDEPQKTPSDNQPNQTIKKEERQPFQPTSGKKIKRKQIKKSPSNQSVYSPNGKSSNQKPVPGSNISDQQKISSQQWADYDQTRNPLQPCLTAQQQEPKIALSLSANPFSLKSPYDINSPKNHKQPDGQYIFHYSPIPEDYSQNEPKDYNTYHEYQGKTDPLDLDDSCHQHIHIPNQMTHANGMMVNGGYHNRESCHGGQTKLSIFLNLDSESNSNIDERRSPKKDDSLIGFEENSRIGKKRKIRDDNKSEYEVQLTSNKRKSTL